jgi:hypothetical protein
VSSNIALAVEAKYPKVESKMSQQQQQQQQRQQQNKKKNMKKNLKFPYAGMLYVYNIFLN